MKKSTPVTMLISNRRAGKWDQYLVIFFISAIKLMTYNNNNFRTEKFLYMFNLITNTTHNY